MVRTNRSSMGTTTPASMDDIDLDVMFADDGDALFDGLDIDLDMDDITGGTSSAPLESSTRPNTSSYNRGVISRPPPQQALPTSPDNDIGEDDLSRTRRKTKRKAKTPSFFEDDDDDYDDAPASKKKRKGSNTSRPVATNAAATTKKKPSTKTIQDDQSITSLKPSPSIPSKAKGKTSKSSSVGMPPPLARNGPWDPTISSSSISTSGHNVAAAGQFGNRQKRPSGASFPSLPKGGAFTGGNTSAPSMGGRTINKLPLARSSSETGVKNKSSGHQQQSKRVIAQPESTYCGLQPSATHFYPFMPALPSEPVIKSRKVYGSVDRIHTSLVGFIHTPPTTSSAGAIPAKENEPLFLLLQEAFKDEKSAASSLRLDSIGISIGELRHAISSMDKNRIISDWYDVCTLIQRQHDFLKQNCDNMERWCRDTFSKDDYAEVYAPSKKRKESDAVSPLSVLKTFTKREIKVRMSFTGAKDAKMPAFALAAFPPLFLPNEVPSEEHETKSAPTKKKSQAASSAAALQDGRTTELTSSSTKAKPPLPLSYANMKPPRRRRNVAEMIARTARELSKTNSLRIETRRRTIDRREADVEKAISPDIISGIHTAGMWKWLELSGFFTDITMSEVEDRLQDFRSITVSTDDATRYTLVDQTQPLLTSGEGVNDNEENASVFQRLQSLLIDVESRGDEDYDDELLNLTNDSMNESFTISDFVDMTDLTLEERSGIVLRKFGFKDRYISLPSDINKILNRKPHVDDCQLITQNGKSREMLPNDHECDDLADVIAAMKSDLARVEEITNERVAFLESSSRRYRCLKDDQQQRSEREASLIAKYQQVMRKSKEIKAKSGAAIRNDSLALPW